MQILVGAGLPAMDVNDNAGCLNARVVRAFFASRLAPTGAMQILVGAGLPAMDVNDNAGCLNARVARALFASRLAPTGLIGLSDQAQARAGGGHGVLPQSFAHKLVGLARQLVQMPVTLFFRVEHGALAMFLQQVGVNLPHFQGAVD